METLETRSPKGRRTRLFDTGAVTDVRMTLMRSLSGSAQATVPIKPPWPKPTAKPKPRGVSSPELRFRIIWRSVDCLTVGEEEAFQEPGYVSGGTIASTPRRSQISLIWTVPVQVFGFSRTRYLDSILFILNRFHFQDRPRRQLG